MHVSKPVLYVQDFVRDKALLKNMSFNKDVGVFFDPSEASTSVPPRGTRAASLYKRN